MKELDIAMTPAGIRGVEGGRTLIHRGGIANADVFRRGGRIEKDYTGKPWIVRVLYGRKTLRHEYRILHTLEPLGIVPGGNAMPTPDMMVQDFVEGTTLREGATTVLADYADAALFFKRLEAAVKAVHAAGFVHLDLHNARNVMIAEGMRPMLLDWQSAFSTKWMPGFARRFLQRVDLAGIYKHAANRDPGLLDDGKNALLSRQRFLRKLWPFNKGRKHQARA